MNLWQIILKKVPVNHKREHVHLTFIEVYRRFSLEIKYENGDMAKRKIYQIQWKLSDFK